MTQKPQKKTKRGRPRHHYSPKVVELVENIDEEADTTVRGICLSLSISTTVFYKWMDEHDEFSDAVTRLRARADDVIESAFFERAKGYTETLHEQKLDKDGCVHDVTKEVHYPGDTGAQMNWLKNRRPAEWRDTKVVEIEGDHVAMMERYLAEKEQDEA